MARNPVFLSPHKCNKINTQLLIVAVFMRISVEYA